MLLLYIFILVMLFSLTPYVIAITKKASACAAMRRAIEYSGGRLAPTKPLWYIGNPSKRECDLHILNGEGVISVKVIGFFLPGGVLNFKDSEHYEIATVKKGKENELKLAEKKKQPYDFGYKMPDEWKKLPHARVILITDPYPYKITKQNEPISIGDDTGEGQIYTTTALAELCKNKK